jgi:hypothetical protein
MLSHRAVPGFDAQAVARQGRNERLKMSPGGGWTWTATRRGGKDRQHRAIPERFNQRTSSPALGQAALLATEGVCHFTTRDREGSRTRRSGAPRRVRDTTIDGVGPGHGRAWALQTDSGAETAFLVEHGQPIARAAQHRPVPKHQSWTLPPGQPIRGMVRLTHPIGQRC